MGWFNDWRSGVLAEQRQTDLPYLGFRVFRWLIGVVFVMLGLIVFFAWSTHPNQNRYMPALLATNEQTQAWDDAWTAWIMSIKELGQIFLLTPVFPLIGAVLGYIFGREAAHGAVHQQQVGQQQQADQATAPTPQEEGHQEEAQS